MGQGVREMNAIYQAYGQRFKSYETFKQFYYSNIDNHKFIMWNNETDKFQTFRAPENIPKFKLKYNKKY